MGVCLSQKMLHLWKVYLCRGVIYSLISQSQLIYFWLLCHLRHYETSSSKFSCLDKEATALSEITVFTVIQWNKIAMCVIASTVQSGT